MRRIKSLQKFLALLFALALVAAACGSDSDDDTSTGADDDTAEDESVSAGDEAEGDVDTEVEESVSTDRTYGGDISVGLEAEATGLRPWEEPCSSPCINISTSIYDKLIEFRADGTYGGFLAESFESNDDFTEWSLTLRSGVTFHNGVELTSQTLVDMFEIQKTGAASSGRIAASFLADVEVVDDLTAKYILSQSNSAFIAYLERIPLGLVFEPAAAAADPDGFTLAPIGTGPFMMDKRDIDNETVVVRNPDYWGVDQDGNQLPYLDSITWKPIPDEGTRLDSLLSGTVDAMQTLRQGTIRDARDNSDSIVLYEFQGNNVGGGMFNVAAAPYDDVRVRRGLTLMNQQEAVIDALGGTGISLPGTQWFSPDSPWYSEAAAAAWPQFDPEEGATVLQGYIDDPDRSDGKAVGEKIEGERSWPPDPTLVAAMQVLEQEWSNSGLVDVNLTQYDQATHINYALGADPDWLGEHGAHCWRWSSDQDPSTELNRQFAPYNLDNATEVGLEGVFTPTNYFNYFDADIFADLSAAIQTDDFETRKALYESVMIKIAEDVPVWYSGHTATMIATIPEVQGINGWVLPDGTLGVGFPAAEGRWHEVWLQQS
ncbi:MAG: ABC transporter substrate-binding protein [Actinomycetia bacterium]|nr:ABC transporter substrate-binding protein [Actinomycetes bacterium]